MFYKYGHVLLNTKVWFYDFYLFFRNIFYYLAIVLGTDFK